MNRNNNRDENGNANGGNNDGGWSWWTAGAAAAGVGAIAGLGYYLSATKTSTDQPATAEQSRPPPGQHIRERRGFLSTLADSLEEITNTKKMDTAVSRYDVLSRPNITNLNSLVHDIYVRYIALKKEDFQLHYRVFLNVFACLQKRMKEVDRYYERYASDIQFAGSHYDRLRIKKPDEFDMDIVIGVPVNMVRNLANPLESDIVIEQNSPGFVQLRAGTQYLKLLVRDGSDCQINRTAYEWLDDRKYILRSKFIDWFKSVGHRALNKFESRNGRPSCYVDGKYYSIRTSSSGPAWTIIIEAYGFRLDVDLVPALKFPEDRWLNGKNYRPIPLEYRRGYWMVVPKPNKAGNTAHDEQRSWRIALQEQEKQLFNNTYNLRQVIRLLKKFRDAQGMEKIASYYIKTIFFWEIVEKKNIDPTFWQRNDIAYLFQYMMKKFYEALDAGKIPYFWNKNNNMIENLNCNIRNEYKRKIMNLLNVLDNPRDYKLVAKYLLTNEEYLEYQRFL